jgi:hypothetical protein
LPFPRRENQHDGGYPHAPRQALLIGVGLRPRADERKGGSEPAIISLTPVSFANASHRPHIPTAVRSQRHH